jgi:hypothetical protein
MQDQLFVRARRRRSQQVKQLVEARVVTPLPDQNTPGTPELSGVLLRK